MKAHFGLAKMRPSDGRKPHFGAFACAVDLLFGLRFLIRLSWGIYVGQQMLNNLLWAVRCYIEFRCSSLNVVSR
uniref:Uncharacterized protein n=1 Tax=Arundo donax TaxID=35708 RepID=A0A0A8XUG1_ARUDO